MGRKLIFVISVVLLLSMAGNAPAAPIAYTWSYDGGDADWCNEDNWTPVGVPGDNDPCDTVTIPGTINRGPKIGAGCDVTVASISGPDPGATNHVVVDINTGGSLFIHDTWTYSGGDDDGVVTINIHGNLTIDPDESADGDQTFRAPDGGTGNVNVYPGASIWVSGAFRGADDGGSEYNVTMYGGDVNCGWFKLGDDGDGDFIMTGGTWVTRDAGDESFTIRGRNAGTYFEVRVDGGAELYIAGSLRTPQEDDATALINIDDGYFECKEWQCAGESWFCDINEGMIRIKDPIDTNFADIEGWIDSEPPQLTGYNGTVTPIVTKDGDDYVVATSFLHLKAYDESPVDHTTNICPTSVEVSWTPGVYVQDHNIYFGPDDDDVNESATAVEENWGPNTWSPPGPFELGETYYWRVDTVNDACAVWQGGIWEFQIENGQARNPSPTNEIRGIPYADVDLLSWTPSCVADNHIVWFGEGLLGSIVLFEDDFEDGFDPNWAVTTGWSISDKTDDGNFADHNNNLAAATAGTMRSGDIDTSDANSINVSFVIRLEDGTGAGAVTLSYYNGTTYIPVADWNSLDPCDTWLDYSDTITDSQYLEISNFRIQLVSALTGPNSVYINNVSVSNNWPIAAEYYQGQTSDSNWPVSVDVWKPYGWRIDTITTGGERVRGPHWTFQTGLGGLLMYYKFDGSPGAHLADPITDDSGNNVRFDKYTESGGYAVYGESNPILDSSSAGAVFGPNAGLHRFDPCAPDEIDPLRLSGYQHTVELWVKPTSLDEDMDVAEDDDEWTDEDDDICLIGKLGSWGIWIAEPGDNDAYRFYQDGNGEGLDDETAVVDEWAHLALVYDQTAEDSYQMYLNGRLVDSQDEGTNANDNNYPVTIGYARQDDVNLGRFFEGVIDEVRIHDVALGPCEFLISPGPEWPSCPSPQNGEQDVDPCGVVLTWTPGSEAATRKVYFSADFGEVDTFDAAALEYQGSDTNVPLADLDDGTVYYWRVVALNGGGPWEGPVWTFSTTYIVDDPNLLLWYEFDEVVGDIAYDHSGHGFHAEDADNQWDPNGGKWGSGCLVFDEDISLQPSSNVFKTITSGITLALWVNIKPNWETDAQVLFDTGASDREFKLQAAVPNDDGQVVWRAGNDSNDLMVWRDATPRAWAGDWHHLAFVKDENAGTMSIYFDGLLADTKSGVFATLTNIFLTRPFKIGSYGGSGEDYEGSMDDFRIYDRVLTDDEVAALYRGGDLDIAWGPDPYDGRADASPDANLTWYPGDNAADHNVFFGTTRSEVEAMVDPCATLDLGNELYDPGPLELDTYYYWRIDEVNEHDPNTWTGPVWRFKVANYISLDDFERYDSGDNRIYYNWYDQRSQDYPEATGSWLGLATPPTYPVHMGQKAMSYQFDTDDAWADLNYAEAWLPLDEIPGSFQDWTSIAVRLLTVFFYGDADNDTYSTEQMYIGVSDTAGLYAEMRYGDHSDEDMNDLKVEEWQRWDIPFVWFTDNNSAAPNDVNFLSVASVRIGFGNRRNPAVGGAGVVYFDDLRLTMPICRPEYGPTGDLNGDCVVGVADFGEMTDEWLDRDVNFADEGVVIEEPCDANLAGYYKLDGDPCDSSGNGYHGTVEDSNYWAAGIDQYAVGLNGGWVLVEDEGNTPELRRKHKVSVMAWINLAERSGDDIKVIVRGRDNHETYGLEINDSSSGLTFLVRDANEMDGDDPKKYDVVGERELPLDEWVHIAGTYDGNEMTAYVNGEVGGTTTPGPNELYADVNDGFVIGGRYGDTGGRFVGEIDDVRVYDYALSQAQVAWLASQGTGVVLLISEANFYLDDPDPEVINFKDFARLFDYWGDEQLWPPEPEP